MNQVRTYVDSIVPTSIVVGGILPKFVMPSDVRALKTANT